MAVSKVQQIWDTFPSSLQHISWTCMGWVYRLFTVWPCANSQSSFLRMQHKQSTRVNAPVTPCVTQRSSAPLKLTGRILRTWVDVGSEWSYIPVRAVIVQATREREREIESKQRENDKLEACARIPTNESCLLIPFFNYLQLTFASVQQRFSMLAALYIETWLLPSVNEVL